MTKRVEEESQESKVKVDRKKEGQMKWIKGSKNETEF